MLDDVQSSMLAQWLKKKIRASAHYHYKLRLLANCMTYVSPEFGVQILANGTDTRIAGPRPCNHSWACPECTARQMKKYSARIGAALDALAQPQYNLHAAMFTFTVFHTHTMTCEQSFDLLKKSWETFNRNKTWCRKRDVKDKSKAKAELGEDKVYKSSGAFAQFNHEFDCSKTVKTLEVTYGQHGWHPHIHMLFWFKAKDLQKIADWEQKLADEWAKVVDRNARKMFPEQEYEIRKFLESKTDRDDAQHVGLYISKTPDGKIKRWSSSDYICGWGGNAELTGLQLKTARGNNMTPFQMLEKAHDCEFSDPEKSEKLLDKYFDFAWTVIKNRISRVQFSRNKTSHIKAIIDNWMRSNEYQEMLKKKKESLHIKPYRNIAWFSKKQWSDICNCDNQYLIPLIRCFANVPDDPIFGVGAFDLITELCIVNNVSPPVWIKSPKCDIAKAFNELVGAA